MHKRNFLSGLVSTQPQQFPADVMTAEAMRLTAAQFQATR
jgi:hypothetical protein